MINEKYSIEVSEDMVLIYGNLTIEETFDFLSFYERKGYKIVASGYQNSALCICKKDESDLEKEKK